MLLAIDVGNSNTVLGLYRAAELLQVWRISTMARTPDELGLLLRQLLGEHRPAAVAVCTVVPSASKVVEEACRGWLGVAPRHYGADGDFGMPVLVESPAMLGPDRVVNALAARALVPAPFLVVDFGTATTFDAVDKGGSFVGGAIAPGDGIGADALVSRTARLPRVEARAPAAAIGRNTVDAITSGLWFGYVGLVDTLARRIKEELGGAACLATGGLAPLLGPACREIDAVHPHLTLEGLRRWMDAS
jgi:type III pantothenate kinase